MLFFRNHENAFPQNHLFDALERILVNKKNGISVEINFISQAAPHSTVFGESEKKLLCLDC